jgi:hypothetical protein
MNKLIILVFAFTVSIAQQGYGQCRTFVKNNCGEAMAGFVPGENFNAARLMPGDEAEMKMAFSKGEDYRLFICYQPVLEGVEFQILDTENNILFDNREHELTNTFDFRVPDTQELRVNIKVAKGSNKQITPQGCVAILVGTKVLP